jgi:hypothetical protein
MNAEITSQLIETKRALRAAHVRVAHLSVFLDSLVCLFFDVNCVHFVCGAQDQMKALLHSDRAADQPVILSPKPLVCCSPV